MPYATSYVDDGKGVHKVGTGIVTGSEIFASAVQESSNAERARKLRYGLIDFSQVTEMKVTPEDIHRIVEINRKLASYTPAAVVAIIAPAQLPYALSRLWHTLSDDLGWKSNVYHERQDALAWLRKHLLPVDGTDPNLDQYPFLKLPADTELG
jgi:hypothetical protein